MKKKKMLLAALAAAGITAGGLVYAADHIDSPLLPIKLLTLPTCMYSAVRMQTTWYLLPIPCWNSTGFLEG